MNWWTLIIPSFLVGWYAHWWFRLRPFAKDVETHVREIKDIFEEAEKR